jgi:hypothetical protein
MALAAALWLGAGVDARASISVTVTFDDLLQRSIAVAVVVPIDRRGVWEDGRIVTYTHVRVERLVAGRLPGEVWVRTFGGSVGRIGQIVEGEATFNQAEASLLFIHLHGASGGSPGIFGVVEGAQGQFSLVTTGGGLPHLAAARLVGALVPPPGSPRLARDELVGRSLEDAVREINAAWPHFHSTTSKAQ